MDTTWNRRYTDLEIPWQRRATDAEETLLSPPAKDESFMTIAKNGLADAAKTGLSIPLAVTIGALVLAAAMAFGRVQTAIEYQEKVASVNAQLTAAQIEVSSLRNSALVFSQENGRKDADIRRLEARIAQLEQELITSRTLRR